MKSNTSNSNNNRGRFLLGRAGASLRRSQNKSNKQGKTAAGGKLGRDRPRLSPLKENVPSRSMKTNTSLTLREREQHVTFHSNQSSVPIRSNNFFHSTGFSQAEIYDLEESFKLFDIYGEGNVQVGDLRSILAVLKQEQQQQQSSTAGTKYPYLDRLTYHLSELSDEDTLHMDEYIQLMASTTITNSIVLDNKGEENQSSQHFSRVFELFDTEGKGYITIDDLERIAIELGEHDMTRGELQEMIDRARGGSDSNGNEVVGIEDFTRMMTMSLFPSKDDRGEYEAK
ncbi:unnamed protein product [Pseudo-nitzschia multistriata]|uniref:EF-hand domain-containing protein n=1 Tax=Pseudo-nitzschia multistriata TaxID=183589 RepID=A0A448Z9G8_9STRA|nr:unnamed protein product [Pseudo-nitzschia multistriata]